MADKTLKCKDCGAEFIFTEGEQAFYKEKGFENDPVRKVKANKNRGCFLKNKERKHSYIDKII